MSDEHIGTLARLTCEQLAERAAERIMELSKPHAVCIDPDGRVTIEPYDRAVFEDVVGVYSRDLGLIPLYREVRDNLAYVIEQRGITGQRRRRYVASERRAA